MPTAFDAYSQPKQQQTPGIPQSAFSALSSQQKQGGYQTIPQLAQRAATTTATAKLDQNRQNSYLGYIDQVVNAELPSNEGDLRAPYIPSAFSPGSYQGSNYVNPNSLMAAGAVPSAYEYAGYKNNPFNYGVDRLEWGGPTSQKTTQSDFLDRNRITQSKNMAEDALRRAIIPEYLRKDVSNSLANKWTQGWGTEWNRLKGERADQQANWWSGSDWANKAFRPAWMETISPAQNVEISPFIAGHPAVDPIPAQPEVAEVPYRPPTHTDAVYDDVLISPEQQAIAAGYYTPSQQEYMDWVNQDAAAKQNDQYQQYKVYDPSGNGGYSIQNLNLSNPASQAGNAQILSLMNGLNYEQSPTFTGSQATEWQDEFGRQNQNLRDAWNFWQGGLGAWNLDPTSPNNAFYKNEQFWGGQGKLQNRFTDGTGVDAFGNAFNSDLGYTYFGDPAQSLMVESLFPDQWGNYTPGQEYRAAQYDHRLVSPAFDDPGQAYVPWQPGLPEVPGISAVPDTPAVYQDIPAVTTEHPISPKQGFQTIVDPITGVAIPNWWLNGGLGSNRDLAETYGSPEWYIR